MVAIEIRTPAYDEQSGQIDWRGRALLLADAAKITVYGQAELIDLTDSVVDLATGKKLLAGHDPEAWARNLPGAYRAGDLVAVVLFDTETPTPPVRLTSADPVPSIPAPPAPAARALRAHA